MPKLVIGMQNNRSKLSAGFTLIEILVVVLIIGITIGMALLAFGDFGGQRRMIMAGEHFINYLKLVQHQAILESSTLGIRVSKNTYQVMRFQSSNQWQLMPKASIFHQQNFPKNAKIRINKMGSKNTEPQIIINSSGDMTPFKLDINSKINIIGQRNGSLTLEQLKAP